VQALRPFPFLVDAMACPICERRKPKRTCPAKGAKICSVCCGEQRERTLDCPLDCTYLEQAHESEVFELTEENYPFPNVKLDDRFLRVHQPLIEVCARAIAAGFAGVAGVLDADARAALDSLIESYQAAESGIVYESTPDSLPARELVRLSRETIDEYRRVEHEQTGIRRTTDEDVKRALIFLARAAVTRDNGRPRGRAFLHFVVNHFPAGPEAPPESAPPIIVPG